MEPTEIDEFAKQMDEGGEAGESNMRHVSLVISILAVLVAMVTVLGHREHTEAILMQARASDTWSQYQSRKMRVYLVTGNSELLTLQPSSNDTAVQAKLQDYKTHLVKWQAELDQDTEKAKEYEAEVAAAESKAARYDLGEALLQIAVVLASITLLTRHQLYVVVAMVLGLCGLLISASALMVH
jgi:hypothetical protein